MPRKYIPSFEPPTESELSEIATNLSDQSSWGQWLLAEEAGAARRAGIHPTERLAEDGAKLQQKIESEPDMAAVLEVSRSHRSRCRANDCFYRDPSIRDRLHIRVDGVRAGSTPTRWRSA